MTLVVGDKLPKEPVQSDALPLGWRWGAFDELTVNFDGQRVPVSNSDRKLIQGAFPYYGASGIIDYVNEYIFDGKYLLIAEDGANLLSRSTPIAFEADGRFWVNNHAHVVQVPGCLIPLSYLRHYINSIDLRVYISGSAQPKLNQKNLNRIQVPLPPLNEQRRIVVKIEALTARSQRAKEALDAIPPLLERFRQSVLAAAFRGDLTADWREENPDVEPASVLLERIRAKRRHQWEVNLSARGRDPSRARCEEVEIPDANDFPELPKNWIWTTLEQLVSSLRNGLSKKPADKPPGIPILRISSVRSMEVDTNDIRFYRVERPDELTPYFLRAGDLLFTRYNGSQEFVGVCGLVPALDYDLIYPDKLIRAQLVKELIVPKYLELVCNVGISRSHIERHVKTSAGQHGIAGSDIKTTPIPLPPLKEQIEIVNLVIERFSAISNLQIYSEDCLNKVSLLNQSILAKAFRGELVPQDPNDEPASVLLERIRTEREAMATKPKRGRSVKERKGSTKTKIDPKQQTIAFDKDD
ncbi:restriction endonuclease subunit S [Leptolyngbya sp. FACHB-261]|uniref:restriction endonuclease subunit S n=1 Tax=Leptolyngbya sp. FACHB-261 TaxID=2692806 RepID=UPI0018F00D97|nr:restriction endonuclease subunit S [Leptolyngbya sp. FACHB-261]